MVTYPHPRPSVTVDIVLLQKSPPGPQVLLIERAEAPFQGRFALPGGFVDLEESLRAAAERELKEETGLTAPTLQQIYTFGDPDRDPRGRVISVAYGGWLEPDSGQVPRPAGDARKTAWFPVDDLPLLAFDHRQIIQKALDVLGSPGA